MRRADRSFRVLLVSPRLKDRAFMRESGPETADLFDGLSLAWGEKAFFQRYMGPQAGWMTIRSKAKAEAA